MTGSPIRGHRRTALDGAERRRLYLFRHGAVDYVDENGAWVEDPDAVDLNAQGRAQADAMADLFRDVRVDKYRMSGFWDTPLDSILRNLGVQTLLFGGVNADQCVLCTLQDANFLGYDCVLVEDCAATTSPEFCMEATLYNVKQCFGFVAQSSALLAGLEVM